MAVDQAQMQNFSSMFLPAVESVNPCLILIVRRENIVGDTMEVLRKSKNVDYKKPLKVKLMFLYSQKITSPELYGAFQLKETIVIIYIF